MKTVRINNVILSNIIGLLFLSSCGKKNVITDTVISQSVVEHNQDTITYKINLNGEDSKSTLYTVRDLYAGRVNLGAYNSQKEIEALKLHKENSLTPLYLKYTVSLKRNDYIIKLWEINMINTENIEYPILEQGATINKHFDDISKKVVYSSVKDIVRIKLKRDEYQDFECLNFRINSDNTWELISKEKLNTTLQLNKGYCIDTISKNLNNGHAENIIIFHQAFDNFTGDCSCNN
ncbi:hypothetical protein GV828_09340 [Flavobacterium sp. NST-5]|uniref:Lipoprotein n=1 Tax=Flavobacterium ichthyis TaxID=2698827 RepID=A0ABW9ZE64_9FLAO|nr:hypothetical protein [Flavobacterium ichthyis]NBL65400.1 hypothetical protein [Flavobacterium ichthyis]